MVRGGAGVLGGTWSSSIVVLVCRSCSRRCVCSLLNARALLRDVIRACQAGGKYSKIIE